MEKIKKEVLNQKHLSMYRGLYYLTYTKVKKVP